MEYLTATGVNLFMLNFEFYMSFRYIAFYVNICAKF